MNYRRAHVPGGTYFFTLVTQNRQPVLLKPTVHNRLRSAINTVKSRHHFSLTAWCILPDHMHFIWRMPQKDDDYALRWRLIKHYVSIGIGIPQNLWQKRYWEHCITSEKDFETHMHYLHHNPVKHGYVEKAADWKYSSFHYFVDKDVYPRDWGCTDETQIDCGEPE